MADKNTFERRSMPYFLRMDCVVCGKKRALNTFRVNEWRPRYIYISTTCKACRLALIRSDWEKMHAALDREMISQLEFNLYAAELKEGIAKSTLKLQAKQSARLTAIHAKAKLYDQKQQRRTSAYRRGNRDQVRENISNTCSKHAANRVRALAIALQRLGATPDQTREASKRLALLNKAEEWFKLLVFDGQSAALEGKERS